MSKNKNSVALIGMVGMDAVLKQTQEGVPYARFSLATSEGGYKRHDGTMVPEVTQWHNIIAWRNLAEICGKYVRKGMKMAVDGKIVYGQYDKQGIKCMSVDIVASDVVLMSRPQDSQGTAQGAPQSNMAQSVGNYQGGGRGTAQSAPQTDLFGQPQGQQGWGPFGAPIGNYDDVPF